MPAENGSIIAYDGNRRRYVPSATTIDELAAAALPPPVEGIVSAAVLLEYSENPVDDLLALDAPEDSVVYMKSFVADKSWDFRDLSAPPSDWAKRGSFTPTFGPNGMTFAGGSAGSGFLHDLGAAQADADFTAVIKLFAGTAGDMQGLFAVSPSGDGVGGTFFNNPNVFMNTQLDNFSYINNGYVNAGGTPSWPVAFRVRKSMVDAKVFASHSFDNGSSWSAEFGLTPAATNMNTINNLFLGSSLSGGSITVSEISVTSKVSGGLLGWWDGSDLNPF